MRIVGGRHRGRSLAVPRGLAVRPTSDRAREALFNILEHGKLSTDGRSLLPGSTVLDAFAGTGAFALEALSRGAAHALLLERDPAALAAARDNARKLGEAANLTIRQADATRPGPAPAEAAIAFLDPPYGQGLAGPALEALAREGWFGPSAIVVVEIDGREAFRAPAGFALLEERRYGRARLVFLRHGA